MAKKRKIQCKEYLFMNCYPVKRQIQFLWFLLLMFTVSTGLQARPLPDFTVLVEENSPAVVNISTKQHKSQRSRFRRDYRMPEFPEDSPFNDLFRHFFGEGMGQDESPKEFDSQSLGSGFIISGDGYIMTNHHVVNEADEIIVRLSDHREFVAKVIGSDKRSDIALLKIDARDLPKVKIGSANDIKVGAWVLAIGSPFGFDHSVTAGIVSAKGRSLPNENYVPFIQTDVAINPGNSGGPLFNLKGEVIGVNSQIYSRTGGFMGLSFAIPIEMAMNVADQLKDSGRVSRGWLGVLIQDVTRELADSFGMKHPSGALVARVLPDSPAEKAGIQPGDVILKYNGTKINDSSMLPPLVGASRIDKPAKVIVMRGGKRITLEVSIGELPEEEGTEQAAVEPEPEKGDLLGMQVANIDAKIQHSLKLDSASGVLVEEIMEGPAKSAGVRKGDVIRMLNNTRINSVDELREQISALPAGKSVAVLVFRQSGPIFLAMRVPD
jgi:serine protease Do